MFDGGQIDLLLTRNRESFLKKKVKIFVGYKFELACSFLQGSVKCNGFSMSE